MTPLVIMVGADKGGVGKTTITRALADYLESGDAIVPSRIFDTEHPAGDLVRFHPGARVIDMLRVRDQMEVFDGIASDRVTLVDIRAGMLSPLLAALDAGGLLADVRAGTVNLAVLHVLGPTIASLEEIAQTAKAIGGGARHLLVKNRINDTGFDLAADPRYAPAFAKMAPVTIDVPKLTEVACEEIQRRGMGFAAFAADPAHSRMLRGYVRTWLDAVFAEFERVGLGEMMSAPAGSVSV